MRPIPCSTPVLALLALLGALVCAPAAPAALKVGAVGDITWGSSRADIDREIALMRETGITTIRADVSWKGTEPDAPGVRNVGWLAELDYAITRARLAGLEVVVPLVAQVPYWASSDPARYTDAAGRHWNPSYPPTSNAAYAGWAARMAEHFAALGVTTFEIWNEPNHRGFWAPGPDAAAYAALLRPAAAAVRSAVPGARIVLGGLSANDYVYLEALYAAGARSDFDVMAVHPYTGSTSPDVSWRDTAGRWAKDCFCGLAEIRAVMVANGDAAKPVWVTEFGWSTTTARYGVGEADQARFLTRALDRMAAWPWIERAYVYQFRNAPWRKDDPAVWEANLGLMRSDFTPKPALAALRGWIAQAATPTPDPAPVPAALPAPAPAPVVAPAPAPAASPSPTTAPAATPRKQPATKKQRAAARRRAARRAKAAAARRAVRRAATRRAHLSRSA